DGDAAVNDEPAVRSAKDARTDLRVRPGATRPAQDHKVHDTRRAGAEIEAIDPDSPAIDPTACLAREAAGDAAVVAFDAAGTPPTPKQDDTPVVAPDAGTLVVPVRTHEALPQAHTRANADTPAAPDDERSAATRPGPRGSARELRLPIRADGHAAAPADSSAARAMPSPDITLPQAKDLSPFELALRATGRGAGAPLFDRTPTENTAAATQALAFARDMPQPLAARTEVTAEAALHAAPDDATFAPALGAQVALWVKDGVQEARLHLHPAELGPVSVQIALDGHAAHIDFTAAVAATRDSIEQSLPALAAALREAGFTLAGGGVFGGRSGANESGRDRASDGRGHGNRGAATIGADGSGEAVAATPRRWGRSLVDVYA
ncbi:MAG TPA: flagellar hook-length control protein FliK, partial [Burkholderiaceae bacterium]|nr:flagellar hook-length control protein FliK [Burkholderiaceae bacterium]